MSTLSSIWFTHWSRSSYQKLNLILKFLYKSFGTIKDQMDSLLSCNSTDKGKHWYWIIKILEVEIFLL
jgi:hypothetical protein